MSYISGVSRLDSNRRLDSASEHALVDQCRRQNYEAFGKIVDAYQGRVLGFARRMTPNLEEAHDVTQEVFLRAFQAFSKFDGRSSLRTWLFRIAHNLCVDKSRRSERAPAETRIEAVNEGEEQFDISDMRWSPEAVMLDAELQQVLDSGIALMSEKLRSVLLLHDREDMGYEEIAQMLEIPIGTVKSRLFLARAHLQQHLKKYWAGDVPV